MQEVRSSFSSFDQNRYNLNSVDGPGTDSHSFHIYNRSCAAAVPDPSSLLLMGSGVVSLAGRMQCKPIASHREINPNLEIQSGRLSQCDLIAFGSFDRVQARAANPLRIRI